MKKKIQDSFLFRCSGPEVFYQKVFLKILQNSQENTGVGGCRFEVWNFSEKETPAKVFPCEFRDIVNNT